MHRDRSARHVRLPFLARRIGVLNDNESIGLQCGSLHLFRPQVVALLIFGFAAVTGILGTVLMWSGIFLGPPVLGLSGSACILGWLLLTWVAHTVRWDESTLSMMFWFRHDQVAWGDVQAYRKLWGPQEFPGDTAVTVTVWVRYCLSKGNLDRATRAIVLVPGTSEGKRMTFFPPLERYVTPFDRYVARKNARSIP
jgi:hypothetical protein